MDALKIALLYPNTGETTLQQLLESTTMNDILQIRKLIEERINKERRKVYIASYVGCGLPQNILLDFVRNIRGDYQEWEYYRQDPILIVGMAVFNKYLPSLSLEKYDLLPYQYLSDYMHVNSGWCLRICNNESVVKSHFKYGDEFILINDRPTNLFKQLAEFGEKNNWIMNIDFALKTLPSDGIYRLYD